MIDVDRVTYSYDGETPVLRGLSLTVHEGEFLCVLGGNGSGKSTLAKHLNALLVPDEGRVRVFGLDSADPEYVYDIRSRVGMVFQNPDDQIVATLVENDVAFGPENLGMKPAEIREHVGAALKAVGLAGFERRETHALSGGQKQRVACAGVLAMEPRVLVLDEASSMLDPAGRAALMRICRALHERGMGIVMITHYMEEAAEADRVVVVDHGLVTMEGTPDEVLSRPEELEHLNLETPPACRLGMALVERGIPLAPRVREADMLNEIVGAWRERSGEQATPGELAGAAQAAGLMDVNGHTPQAPRANSGDQSVGTSAASGAAAESVTVAAEGDAAPTCSQGALAAFPVTASETTRKNPNDDAPAESDPAGSDSADGPAPVPEPVIEFSHVSFAYGISPREHARALRRARRRGTAPAYDEGAWALRDVSFAVRRGEFLGLAGHTGSGKSTLVQHMNGLVHPLEGCVRAFGRDLSETRAATDVKQRIGVVFQYPERQLFAATVHEDVAFGPRNLGLSEEEVDRRVAAALERVGLDPAQVGEKSPFELSGGQQRRVAFAGVLAMGPEVLVLDEPAAGLDPASRREFLDFVARLHDEGLTVVMVSHSMDDLARYCDRVAIFNRGRLFAEGAPGEVFLRAEELAQIGLGVPAAQRMARSLAAAGLPLPTDRLYNTASLADSVAALLASNGGL